MLDSPLLHGAPVTFDTRKAVALLAYLAVSGQPQQRDALAALLWPEADQAHARGALRRTLSVLHAALQRTPYLRIEREQVELCLAQAVSCDVDSFRRSAAGCTTHAGAPQPVHCNECLAQLEQAVALYQDHFMTGFSLRDSAAYDDWQFFQGEEMRRLLAQLLEMLVNCYTARHDWPPALTHARRRLTLDTLHEPAHRQLMLLYAWSDQRAAALRQYQECLRILDEELGVPPLAATTQIYQAILNHQPPPPPDPQETPAAGSHTSESAVARPYMHAASPPLIGRSRQWEALLSAHQMVAAPPADKRQGHLVVIEGEAGSGKTKLAQTFAAHAHMLGASTSAAICYAGEETLAFASIEQLLRQALEQPGARARLDAAAPIWRQETQRLLPELQPGATHQPDTHQLSAGALGNQTHFLEGVARTLAALLQGKQPGILLLDDLHYADGATLDLLAYMVRRLHTLPLLLLVTWCNTDVPPNHRLHQMVAQAARRQAVTVLTLPPLTVEDVAEMINPDRAAAAGQPAEQRADRNIRQLAQRLHAETQGLPLFLVEYLDLLRNDALDPTAAEWPAPQGVRHFLHARMALLSETAQQIAATAAVIGRSFDLETVTTASGRSEEESVEALEELLARRLILEQESDGFDFAHAQLRSLIYAETSQVRRRLLHRRVAEALTGHVRRNGSETAGLAAALAHHYQLGGVPAQAAQWAVTAGEHARQVYANRAAISYFEQALALKATGACAIHLHLGDLHTLEGEYSQAEQSYQAAQRACPANGVAGAIEHRLGRLHHRLGDWVQAGSHFALAHEQLSPAADAERALLLADWSLTAYSSHDLAAAVRLAQQALQHAQAVGDNIVPARAYDILSLVERRQNNLPAALDYARRSLAAAARLDDPAAEMTARNSLALAHAAVGEDEQAIPLLQAALELCLRVGDRHREAALRNNLADLYHANGQPEAAMQQLKQAVAIFAEIGVEAGPDNAEIWKLSEW